MLLKCEKKHFWQIGEHERVYKVLQKVFRINNGNKTASIYQVSELEGLSVGSNSELAVNIKLLT